MKLKDFTVIQIWGIDENKKIYILDQIIPQSDKRTIVNLKKIVESFEPNEKLTKFLGKEFLRK